MPPLLRLLLTTSLLVPFAVRAADYRVDLIVTLNRGAAPDVALTNGRAAQPPVPRAAVDISDRSGLQRAGIRLLPDEQFGLENEWRKLRNSNFRPVLRLAWRLAERPTATAVYFHDDFRYQVQPQSDITSNTYPAVLAFERNRLEGSLQVQQSAGLRVTLDLEYHLPASAPPAEYPRGSGTPLLVNASELMTLNLHAEKRVNAGQTHFFDHPLLGVLLKVSPVD